MLLCTFSFQWSADEEPITFVGRTEGRIVLPRGPKDFGWDPVFLPDGFDQTFAEMSKDVKNSISHRRRALNKLNEYLMQHLDRFEVKR